MALPTPQEFETARSYRWTVYALLVLSLVLLAYPILRIGFDFEIDNNEGWDAFLQARVLVGLSLYHLDTPYFVNNYPPLSFHIVAWLAKLIGDPVIAGRVISVASLVAVAFSCASIVRSAGASRLDATLAWATCVALFCTFGTDYVGINDPHFLGQALFLVAFALYFRLKPSPLSAFVLAALVCIGLLTKHSMLAAPFLMTLDILRRWPWRAKLTYVGSGVAIAAASFALIWFIIGKSFFLQVFSGRTFDVPRGFLMTTDVLGNLQVAVAIVGLALLLNRKQRPFGLIGAYLLLALVEGAIFAAGANDDINHFFEAFTALAIGTGLAVHWIGQRAPYAPARMAMALAINAGVLFMAPLSIGRLVVDVTGDMAERERLFHEDVAYVKAQKGQVLCQSFLLCYRAGLPVFFDPHNVRMGTARGDYPPDLVIGMLKRREIALMQVEDRRQHLHDEYPGRQAMPAFFVHFEDDVFDVLESDYKVARVGHMGLFFVPREGRNSP